MNQPAETNVAKLPTAPTLIGRFAGRFHVEPEKLLSTLKATAFKIKDRPATNEEMMALLVVADQYGLNPFTKEIFAFPDKHKGVVPVVSVDGWARIINDHPQFDGMEFTYSEKSTTPEGGMPTPEWCECTLHRKDRKHPSPIREYLDEVYRPPFKDKNGREVKGPWQSHTKRFLRHKTLIQAARLVFGFSGIYDEDEAMRIIEGEVIDNSPPAPPSREDFADATEPLDVTDVEQPDPFPLLDEYGADLGVYEDVATFLDVAIQHLRDSLSQNPGAPKAFEEMNATQLDRLGNQNRDNPDLQAFYRELNARKSEAAE